MIRRGLNHWPGHQRDRVPDRHWDCPCTVNDTTLRIWPDHLCFSVYHCGRAVLPLGHSFVWDPEPTYPKNRFSICYLHELCCSQISQLPFFHMLLVLPQIHVSHLGPECILSPCLSSQILPVLRGTGLVFSSMKACMCPRHSPKGFTRILPLSHQSNSRKHIYKIGVFYIRIWDSNKRPLVLRSKGVIRIWICTLISWTPWVPHNLLVTFLVSFVVINVVTLFLNIKVYL